MAAPRSLSDVNELIAGGLSFSKTRLVVMVAQFSSNDQLNHDTEARMALSMSREKSGAATSQDEEEGHDFESNAEEEEIVHSQDMADMGGSESSMEMEDGDSDGESEMPLITKSNVGLFVKDEDLLAYLHDFRDFVGGRRVAMRETLKSRKIRVGVDVKDEAMLAAMPDVAKDLA
ncbi:hypothetical protein R1sor_009670 [Riccia sorocarpa]|uniref:Uncharacterized protein n=1 Tax=Riccia sorocarpa TaxID=122646 RepID=A0ABD3HZ51_9MARC